MTINVTKYRLNPDRVFAGTRGSYGMEKLSFNFGDGWDFDTISVTFHPQRGKPIRVPILSETAEIDIPAEVMAHSGESRFVVSGVILGDGGEVERKAITLEGYVDVAYTADDKGGNTRKVTADVYDQLIDQATEIFNAAREDVERSAAEAAESASDAEGFANEAKESADTAAQHRRLAEMATRGAEESAESAEKASSAAEKSAEEAQASERAAKTSEENAAGSAVSAGGFADAASGAATEAVTAKNEAVAAKAAAETAEEKTRQLAETAEQTVKDTLDAARESGEFDGPQGDSPYVGENGNWWVGDVDTGVAAQPEVELDSTLSVEGKAADAKAVGDKVVIQVSVQTEDELHQTLEYPLITITLNDGTEINANLPKFPNVYEILYPEQAPYGSTVGYTGQFAFVKATCMLYVCTYGKNKPNEFVSSYSWSPVRSHYTKYRAPTAADIAQDGDLWADTANGDLYMHQVLNAGQKRVWKKIGGLPESTSADEGKVLTVVDGVPAWAENSSGGSVSVDTTLTVEGAAADAKAVGDELAKKINKTDIVNNLSTLSSDKPLSATQGYMLAKNTAEARELAEKISVFEYGKAQFAEISDAFNSGKACVAHSGEYGTCILSSIDETTGAIFTRTREDGKIVVLKCAPVEGEGGFWNAEVVESGGGSGESDIFNVTLTTNEDGTITASHTSQEIYAAAQEGKTITSISIVGDGVAQNLVPILINANYAWFYFVIAGLDGEHDVAVTIMSIAGSDVSAHTVVINQMTGASANSDGTVGLVPQPLTGQQDYILHGDGAWRKPAETISSDSANTEIPNAKAVYDAIQAAIPDSGDSSGSSAGVVIFKVAYIDGTVMTADDPAVYPEGADMQTLLAAGQARMVVIEPSDSENVFAKKLGILGAAYVEETVIQFAGTITGENGNEAVMATLERETYEITITPLVQNSAGSGSSGGGGVVTITDNGDGTYNSSHTPAEIAAMAETGAVVAVMEIALGLLSAIPLYMCADSVAVFKDFDIDEDIADTKKILVNSVVITESSITVNTSTIRNMTGASASVGGNNGLVPAPAAGKQDYVLHGDGTWRAALSEDDKTDLVHRVIEKLPTWEGGTY